MDTRLTSSSRILTYQERVLSDHKMSTSITLPIETTSQALIPLTRTKTATVWARKWVLKAALVTINQLAPTLSASRITASSTCHCLEAKQINSWCQTDNWSLLIIFTEELEEKKRKSAFSNSQQIRQTTSLKIRKVRMISHLDTSPWWVWKRAHRGQCCQAKD